MRMRTIYQHTGHPKFFLNLFANLRKLWGDHVEANNRYRLVTIIQQQHTCKERIVDQRISHKFRYCHIATARQG